ncbi:MAG: pyridoxal-phosphate dependent enzyme [Anaerolineales bacterium]
MDYPGVFCSNCGEPYPNAHVPYCCSICGGVYDFRGSFLFDPTKIDHSEPGIWRFRHTFGLSPEVVPVSLGEGDTPLLWVKALGREIALKCDYLNPSGSFKDRGSAVMTAWLRSRGVTEVVEDSSGNAGASLAAYAARAGIKTRIFIPEYASGPKRRQIEAYGAELFPIPGSRSDVTKAVRKVSDNGTVYASHAYSPFNLPGYASAAYEIFEQVGKMPGAVVVPAGQGGLLLGLARGFDALRKVYNNDPIPLIIGVQARACAPLWALWAGRDGVMEPATEDGTLAEGVRVPNPVRGEAVRSAVLASRGIMCVVDEKDIMPARDALARLGFYVEPTSAIAWATLIRVIDKLPDPIVVVLTGSGLKYG